MGSRGLRTRVAPACYAVARGRRGPQVYGSWAECERDVKRFSGARFKGCASLEEAQAFVMQNAGAGGAPREQQQQEEEGEEEEEPRGTKRSYADAEWASSFPREPVGSPLFARSADAGDGRGSPLCAAAAGTAGTCEWGAPLLSGSASPVHESGAGESAAAGTGGTGAAAAAAGAGAGGWTTLLSSSDGTSSSSKRGKRFYAVAVGHRPAIYESWDAARLQVVGFVGAKFRGFATREEAEAFMRHPEQFAKGGIGVDVVDQDTLDWLKPGNPAVVIVWDGGSRGNPGHGYGSYRLQEFSSEGRLVRSYLKKLDLGPSVTNNEAEYDILIAALRELAARPDAAALHLLLKGDSKLVVKQITGQWKSHDPRMTARRDEAVELLKRFRSNLVLRHDRSNNVRILGH